MTLSGMGRPAWSGSMLIDMAKDDERRQTRYENGRMSAKNEGE